ncbi:MAG: hypothetical protein HYS18_11545 [Burkholderiales bacterium]|nr:hypothetical protein [Burkholderiales bacterium]
MATLEQIESEAYSAWELRDYDLAAELFFKAELLEKEVASKRGPFSKPDSSFLYRARGAFCLWDGGNFDAARPLLIEITKFDWKNAKLWSDRHSTEKAYARLLSEVAATKNRDGFKLLWQSATARGEELSYPFPTIVPHQKQFIHTAIAFGLPDICKQILGRLDPKFIKKDHELQLLKSQAEDYCNAI